MPRIFLSLGFEENSIHGDRRERLFSVGMTGIDLLMMQIGLNWDICDSLAICSSFSVSHPRVRQLASHTISFLSFLTMEISLARKRWWVNLRLLCEWEKVTNRQGYDCWYTKLFWIVFYLLTRLYFYLEESTNLLPYFYFYLTTNDDYYALLTPVCFWFLKTTKFKDYT